MMLLVYAHAQTRVYLRNPTAYLRGEAFDKHLDHKQFAIARHNGLPRESR